VKRDPLDTPAAAFVFVILLGLLVSTVTRLVIHMIPHLGGVQ
jgi:hypothetical protein